ncbi:MAG TPA: NAD-dependent epimerase/dehydratase family protein [Gemmatimonadales bacterium]|nr:NAD-dependent epimerase/dehydratase family protein [Gemmatimonadales bacterium]
MVEPGPADEAALEERLSRPTDGVVEVLRQVPGDLLVLGAGGKMGPSLARMARRALDALGRPDRVIAVSRFGTPGSREALEAAGVVTRTADLLDQRAVASLPDAPNLVFMAGQKFGTRVAPHVTWAMNALVPALVAQRFPTARTVVFSTGNVYPLTPVADGGPVETDPVGPVGEYAMSCLARERLFEHAAASRGTPVAILRLNYAIDLRYGVLLDTARRVHAGEPVPLRMGHVNVIWQGDANARALQSLALAASPAAVLNLTGPEVVSIRWLAERFAERFGRPAVFEGAEAPDALLSNAGRAAARFGPPAVGLETMIAWTAAWVAQGGRQLGKPTRFEVRDGQF